MIFSISLIKFVKFVKIKYLKKIKRSYFQNVCKYIVTKYLKKDLKIRALFSNPFLCKNLNIVEQH